ncbi:hypothetical protein C5167_025023 [Papaver somniferum]|uniref:CASP-like protein n=1 Tax=Papaver somniferum TaxID=3469 RepID=A0A4Y7JQ68_PAPSO|nr:CASP-like protein 4B4 [Papaver somniferum]RZC63244.1 hypothetical protein C5167_025023 [Papaver somniferum]
MEHYKETTTRQPAGASATVNPQTDMEWGGRATPTIIVRPGKSEKGSLILRVAALVFSAISFIIMATIKDSNEFHESRYVLAGGILSTIYNVFQVSRQGYYLSTGKSLFEQRTTILVNFIGDQITAYLLVSCASAMAPYVATLRAVEDGLLATHETSNLVAASTSMAFLAFFPMAVSAMISAYKLKN